MTDPGDGRIRRRAVFLDRDGTLIEEVPGGYVCEVGEVMPYAWTAAALRRLNQAGFLTVVVTNQSGVARGLFEESFLDRAHAALAEQVAGDGARIDAFYHCPHHPDAVVPRYRAACGCRKPEPGLLLAAARDLGIDLTASWMIGDTWRDIRAGRRAGTRTVLVRSGQGQQAALAPPPDLTPDAILSNLMEAVEWILRIDTSR